MRFRLFCLVEKKGEIDYFVKITQERCLSIMVASVGTVESSGNVTKAAHPDRSEILGRIGKKT